MSAVEDEINSQTAENNDRRNTAKECQEFCRQSEGCSIFTWDANTRSCMLRKGATNRNRSPGKYSGPPICRRKCF